MGRKFPFALACLAALSLAACSTHHTTARPRRGEAATPIYAMSPAQALEVAHWAIVAVRPSRQVLPLAVPYRGFEIVDRIALDTYREQILVVPIEGLAEDGTPTRGFIFDVSGRGSSFVRGPWRNRRLFSRLRDLADATGTRTLVTDPILLRGDVP